MTESNHLCDLWEHTIVKGFKHDTESEQGIKIRQWVIYNKLENFNSILNYPIDYFTPSGNLCYMNEHGDILPYTPMEKYSTCDGTYNISWMKVKMKLKILSVKKNG